MRKEFYRRKQMCKQTREVEECCAYQYDEALNALQEYTLNSQGVCSHARFFTRFLQSFEI